MKIVYFLGHLTFLSWVLVQFAGARQPSYPQIGPSRSRKGSSCRGLHVGLSLDKRTSILPCAFPTTISSLEVPAIGDGLFSSPLLCSAKNPKPASVTPHHSAARRGGSG
jgi:hypothetical protein